MFIYTSFLQLFLSFLTSSCVTGPVNYISYGMLTTNLLPKKMLILILIPIYIYIHTHTQIDNDADTNEL